MNLEVLNTYGAAIAAVLGGVFVKLVDKLLSKRSEDFSEASRIRDELRTGITSLRDELEEYKQEADEWRDKYYEKVEENLKLVTEVEMLRVEIGGLKREFEQFSNGSPKGE